MKLTKAWRRLVSALEKIDGYRPERHYMRGPGPACARRRDACDLQQMRG